MQQQSRRNLYLIKVAYLRGVDQLDCLANRKESWKIVVIVEEEEGGGGLERSRFHCRAPTAHEYP